MAIVKYIRGATSGIDGTALADGQILFDKENKRIFLDVVIDNVLTRIAMKEGAFNGTTQAWNALTDEQKAVFTYVNLTDDYEPHSGVMQGATATLDGTIGLVPKPLAGDQNKVLFGSGEFKEIADVDPIQVTIMPEASFDILGRTVQYLGTTTSNYTNGYFYQCQSDGLDIPTAIWVNIPVMNAGGGTAASIAYDNTTSGLAADDVQEAIDELVASSVPTFISTSAPTEPSDKAYQFIGTTSGDFVHGYFYKVQEVSPATIPATYEWVRADVQPGAVYTAGNAINITNNVIASTVFTGTNAQWEALTSAEKAFYTIVNIVDDADYVGNIVDEVIDGSISAVTSNAVYDALLDKADADDVGDISDLQTTDKSSVVAAINEVGNKSGGHIIKDENGTTFTQRATLVFKNATVEDDPTNNATIVTATGGGSDVNIGDVSGATAVQNFDSVVLKWTDPNDVVISDVTLAAWAGTTVVRKVGSAPASVSDGTVVVTNTTRNQYSSTGYADSNLAFGTTYYYRFFPYKMSGSAKIYTDGTSVSVTIERTEISTVPSQSGTLTYDTTSQTPTWSNYNSSQLTIGGDASGTNAGTYAATFTPKTGYCWTGGSIAAETVNWTIAAKEVAIPTLSGTYTYSGSEQNVIISSYSSAEVTVGGDDAATNAGTYTVTFDLTSTTNYVWSDSTTSQKSDTWTIAKAAGEVTLSDDEVTLDPMTTTATITVSGATGAITITSSDTSVATVSPGSLSAPGGTFTITSVNSKTGSITVTVSVASSSNYEATSETVAVTAKFAPDMKAWATATDAELKDIVDAYYDGSLSLADIQAVWSVGDERTVSLSAMSATGVGESHVAQTQTFVIMGFGGKKLSSDGTTDVLAIVGQKNLLANNGTIEGGYMNSSNDNTGGWNACARRTWCNNVYKNALPSDFKAIFKEFNNITANGSGSTTVTSADYFALPSEKEVFGSTTYADATAEAGNTQFDYYKTAANRIKKRGDSGSADGWWGRSPGSGDSNGFCIVGGGGGAGGSRASAARGLAPFGCI